jgi:hypothetical protein
MTITRERRRPHPEHLLSQYPRLERVWYIFVVDAHLGGSDKVIESMRGDVEFVQRLGASSGTLNEYSSIGSIEEKLEQYSGVRLRSRVWFPVGYLRPRSDLFNT